MQSRLCGLEWQSWANQLLTLFYGPDEYQKVPDNDKGDAGIEGYTLSGGHAYQAYGCVEPIAVEKRYEKQRDKITEDITKFIDNKVKLSRIFGTVKITRWVLFVPYHDSKDLVAHATKKTSEVLEAKLDYVCPSFQVKIADEDQFGTQRDALMNIGLNQVDIDIDPKPQEAIQEWASKNDGLIATLDRKVGLLPTITTEQARIRFREKMLNHFVEGQEAWEHLRQYPIIYEKVFKTKRRRERFLESSWMIHSGPNNELLELALNQFMESVNESTKGLSGLMVESLAWEAVADWLLRCPLDFPEVPANA